MAREIKFRGKRIDNGEWVYGFVYRHDPPLQCFAGESKEQPAFAILKTGFADWSMPRPIDQHEVDGKTVSEFTGLKDKNGKEIYENDIYHMGDLNIKYMVVWCDSGLKGRQLNSSSYAGLEHWQRKIEVIGNIYENPELLIQQPF